MYKKLATATVLSACMGMAHAYVPSSVSLGDAFCDYLTDLTTEGSTGAAGKWNNVGCTGLSVTLGGAQVRPGLQGVGYVMGSSGLAPNNLTGTEATFWVRGNGTWSLYDYRGVEVVKGFWTERSPTAAPPTGGRSLLSAP